MISTGAMAETVSLCCVVKPPNRPADPQNRSRPLGTSRMLEQRVGVCAVRCLRLSTGFFLITTGVSPSGGKPVKTHRCPKLQLTRSANSANCAVSWPKFSFRRPSGKLWPHQAATEAPKDPQPVGRHPGAHLLQPGRNRTHRVTDPRWTATVTVCLCVCVCPGEQQSAAEAGAQHLLQGEPCCWWVVSGLLILNWSLHHNDF